MIANAAAVDLADLACPGCGSPLAASGDEVACERCGRRFAVVAGIPELRLEYPDPYVTREEDVARARELEARFDELDFAGLLREHWRRSGKRPELAERFLAGELASLGRSEAYLDEIERHRGRPLGHADSFLEVGCGTAGLAAAAAARGSRVTGGDLSMRWLVLARKRLSEAGTDGVRLVCFAAERPPFAPDSFEVAAASDVIEHVASPQEFAAGCREVLRPNGLLFLATPNRFSLGLEPHVRLWGVGYLPRPLARRYVRAVRKAPYDHVRLMSAAGLRRVLSRHEFNVEIVPPATPPATEGMYRGVELRLVRAYNRLRKNRAARRALTAVGPFFHVFARNRG